MGKTTKEKVQGWIKSSVKSMLAEEDGAVYFYDIKGGISLMLAWIDGETESENKFCHRKYTIEASGPQNRFILFRGRLDPHRRRKHPTELR